MTATAAPPELEVRCPLPRCRKPAGTIHPDGRAWYGRSLHRSGRHYRDTPRNAAWWVLQEHTAVAHRGMHARELLLALTRAAGGIAATVEGRDPLPDQTARLGLCEGCGQEVVHDGEHWIDNDGADRCAAAVDSCPRHCRPHPGHPQPCNVCQGHGQVWGGHEVIAVYGAGQDVSVPAPDDPTPRRASRPPVGEPGPSGKSRRASVRLALGQTAQLDQLATRLAAQRTVLIGRAVRDLLTTPPTAAQVLEYEPRRPYGRTDDQILWTPTPGQLPALHELAGRLGDDAGRKVDTGTLIRFAVARLLDAERGLLDE